MTYLFQIRLSHNLWFIRDNSLGLVNCNYEPSDVFRNQLIEKPELQSRLNFYAMWLDAVDQTRDFEKSFNDKFKKRNAKIWIPNK